MIYAAKNQVIGAYFGDKKVLKMMLGDVQVYASKVPVIVTIDGVETTTTMGSGEPLSMTLSPSVGRQIMPWTVVVTMDDVDITATAYDKATNTVSIASLEAVVEITAESVEMSADYKPVEYISVATKASGNAIIVDYLPSYKTKLVMDVEVDNNTNSCLFSIKSPNTAPSSTEYQFQLWIRIAASTGDFYWGHTRRGTSGSSSRLFKTGARVTFSCDRGKFKYVMTNDNTYSYTLSSANWEAQGNEKLHIFGQGSYCATGKIYRVTISEPTEEEEDVKFDFIPCVKVEDGVAGLYDIISGTYVKATNYTAAA